MIRGINLINNRFKEKSAPEISTSEKRAQEKNARGKKRAWKTTH